MNNDRVAIFCASLNGGGAEKVVANLIYGFSKEGISVDLLVVNLKGVILKEIPANVRIINFNCTRSLMCIPTLIRYLRKERPNVLFSVMDYVNVIAIWSKFLSGITTHVVVSAHAQQKFFTGSSRTLKGKFLEALLRISYRRADKIVAVSDGLANELISLNAISARNVCTIYNPIINVDLYSKSEERVIHSWITGRVPIILAVGRLSKEKDYPTLIRAFNIVRQNRAVRLLILGEGGERPELEAFIHAHNLSADVELLGFLSNPYPFMRACSCLVLSSSSEGFGNVLVEALALKCRVVSTNAPFGPNEILEGGKWGSLVPVADPVEMANAILRELDGERLFHDEHLKEHLMKFSVDVIIKQYINVLLPFYLGHK